MNDSNIKLETMPWTGERYLPEMQGNIELEHIHRYLFAKQLSIGKRVLDIASGEGYGAALLAQDAASVVGVDIAAEAVAHATTKYRADNLEFRLGSCAEIPLVDHSVDVVVSFETIEHHSEHDAMMREIKRVLIPGGVLVISSPEKLEYSDIPGYNNPYHVKELYRDEFKSLLDTCFKFHYIAGQRVVYGSAIFDEEGCSKVRSYDLSDKSLLAVSGIRRPVYLVAVASDADLPLTESGILELPVSDSDAVREGTRQITNLNQTVTERDGQIANLNQTVTERDGQIANLNQTVTEGDGQIANLNQTVTERDGQIANLNQTVTERDGQIANLNQTVTEGDGQIANLNQTVTERDGQIANLNQTVTELLAFQHLVINSTIWKLSSSLRKFGPVKRSIGFLIRNPDRVFPSLERLIKDQSSGGWPAFKRTLKAIPMEISHDNKWLAYQSRYGSMIRKQVNKQISGMVQKPLISVLLPTYETSGDILRETLDSVIAQLYPEWELCIADDGSTQPHVRKILEAYARRDKRIHLSFHDGNTGIAAATNRALSMARGEYSVLLDHDDLLEKQALFRVAESALADGPDMIYSDEVLVSPDGKTPLHFVFRPAFSLELLRSHPYIVHMVAFRTALVREIGGLDESLNISQDYDLVLRLAEKSHAIVHIPEVLYSWRQIPGSSGNIQLERVMETSSEILAAHLARSGETATVTPGKSFNYFEVRYPLQAGLRVAIVIPTKNHGELVRMCVESLERTIHDISYDIVVIDHESTDAASLAYFSELGKRHRLLHYKGPFNFSTINNWAVSQIGDGYSHYLFCNNDIEAIEDGWLNRMLELGQKPDAAIVGASLLYPDRRTYQHAGVCVGMHGAAEHFAKFVLKFHPDESINHGYLGSLITNHELSAVTGACLLMRKDAFEALKGFDETLAVGFGDVDLCLRSSGAGYRVLYCPHAELIHHESYTRGKSTGVDPHPLDSAFFLSRWHSFLETGDPYYNPNLSINNTNWLQAMEFSIRVKNRIVLQPMQHNRPVAKVAS